MADEQVHPPIQTKYAEQLAADLAANQAEQATLTARLNQLRQEEKWLAGTLDSMPVAENVEASSPAADQPATTVAPTPGGRDEAAVPQPRAEKTASGAAPAKKGTASKRTASKAQARSAPAKKTAVRKTAPAKKTEPAKAAARKSVNSQHPTLGELLTDLLQQQPGEPKKVSEIRAELETSHPERATSEQVVRNALTKLVAQGKLEKDNRQGLVLYTWPAAVPATEAKDSGSAEVVPAGA
ncbi:hypothetical protein EAO71_03535 [Streptomyces sp. ms191]|uniref:hypothetical protein n=1 Tax=Streptomyces sp. ms191 TaxID=1827978 RepID=UPI0011CECE43|nr:hypothetical protein [Streptomyces sp. ms191]TXS32995.1 hypothetical protein EAO71_03535 [Streptomyces sp. ms191]